MPYRLHVLFDRTGADIADRDDAAAAARLGNHILDVCLRGTGQLIGEEKRRRRTCADAVFEHRVLDFQRGKQLFILVHMRRLSCLLIQ